MVGLEDAVEIISAFENAGIKVFIDVGWGVDALLGYQSIEIPSNTEAIFKKS